MVAVLAVMVVASWAGIGLCLWEIDRVREEASRRPQAAFFSVSGQYPHIRIYPEGFDLATPEKMLESQPKNGKKK